LDQCVPSAYAVLEFILQRIKFFVLFVPHELHVADRAGVIKKKKKMLEQFQVLLKFPLERSAKHGMMFFHAAPADKTNLGARIATENC
jgi:hypothetical protein